MAYTKQTWADLPSKTTPINAARLGHIEDGIYDAASVADTANSGLANKVDKVAGYGLSKNNYSDTDKTKVDGLGTAASKDSTNAVEAASTDLVESGAVYYEINEVKQDLNDTDLAVGALQTSVTNLGKYKAEADSIAPVELDATGASQAYAVDEQFYLLDVLLTATSPIAQNDAIVVYPTAGYNCKPSDSVTGQIAQKVSWDDVEGYVGKNELENKVYSQTTGGITVKRNSDDSIEISGTATTNVRLYLNGSSNKDLVYNGSYILDGCPDGGGNTKYGIELNATGIQTKYLYDSGELSIDFTPSNPFYIAIVIYNGAVISTPVTFKPMLRKAGTPSDYVPYLTPNTDLLSYADNGILGAKNLILLEYNDLVNNLSATRTLIDGVLTINCAAANNSGCYISSARLRSKLNFLGNIPVILSFDYKGDSNFTGKIGYESESNITTDYKHYESYINDVSQIASCVFYSSDTLSAHTITVKNFMIRLVSDTEPTYQPYAKTNIQLTQDKAETSVISEYVEDGATCVKSGGYSANDLFIRNGKIGKATTSIAQGATFTLNTNYIETDIGSLITALLNA